MEKIKYPCKSGLVDISSVVMYATTAQFPAINKRRKNHNLRLCLKRRKKPNKLMVKHKRVSWSENNRMICESLVLMSDRKLKLKCRMVSNAKTELADDETDLTLPHAKGGVDRERMGR